MVGQWRRSCHPQKHNNSNNNNNTRPTIAQYSIPKKDSFYTWIPYTRLGTTNRASHKAHMNKTIHIIRVVLSFEFIKSSAGSCVHYYYRKPIWILRRKINALMLCCWKVITDWSVWNVERKTICHSLSFIVAHLRRPQSYIFYDFLTSLWSTYTIKVSAFDYVTSIEKWRLEK